MKTLKRCQQQHCADWRTKPHQYLRVRVELAQHLALDQGGDVPQQIIRALREQLSFRAELELVPYGTLPRTEQKARRVIKTNRQAGS